MAKIFGAVEIDTNRCKRMQPVCGGMSRRRALLQPKEVNDRGYHFAYAVSEGKCVGCGSCAAVCPDACIEVYRVREKDA